jgi:cysteine synthase A
MTDEELEIARSTPNFRFDVPVAPAPAPAATPVAAAAPAADADAIAFVESAINDEKQPVVMFALEWCEFCWAVRKMFAHFDVPYRSVDLDSVQYQKDDLGGRIRAALTARTQVATIPQVFVGGTLIGGANDTLLAWKEGRLQRMLADRGVRHDASSRVDPFSFLPNWQHPR